MRLGLGCTLMGIELILKQVYQNAWLGFSIGLDLAISFRAEHLGLVLCEEGVFDFQ